MAQMSYTMFPFMSATKNHDVKNEQPGPCGNISDLNLGNAQFESQLGHLTTVTEFLWFCSIPSGKYQDKTLYLVV